MNYKKLVKALLFPHAAVLLLLVPLSAVLLVGSMVFVGTNTVVAYISYALSAYTLTVLCFRTPKIISFIRSFYNNNKYAQKWLADVRLRIKVSLYGSLVWNVAYSLFQLWLGFYHASFWFVSMAVYYATLAVMRFFLARYTSKNAHGRNMRAELVRYRACGWVFLVMNIALSLMVFFMVYWNRTFIHHEITTIAMAAYTFTSFTAAIISIVKYRRYNSPVYSATKTISLASACVSMITLESTMLTTFGADTMDALSRKIMLGATGGVISCFIVVMAVYMINKGTKKLRLLKPGDIKNGNKRKQSE